MDGWCHMPMVLKIMHTFLIDVTFMLLGHYAVHLANIHKYVTQSPSFVSVAAINGIPSRKRS